MKRRILVIILLIGFMTLQVFAEDYPLVKLFEFENKREQGYLFRRQNSELAPQDDGTGSGIMFDTNGNPYMTQTEMMALYRLDMNTGSLTYYHDLNFLDWAGLDTITEKHIFCSGAMGRFQLLDKDFNFIFKVRMLNWPMRMSTKEAYYDEQCDVLFFRDSKSNLYSIEHPSMDEAENKANFKGPTETIEMLKSGKYVPHLTTKNNSLWIDGLSYYWPGKKINKICYQYVDESSITIFVPDNTVRFDFHSPDEQIESIEIHPCGDIYVLRMNWNTNTHILYRVENTWDPEWRASWYAEHPDAPGRE